MPSSHEALLYIELPSSQKPSLLQSTLDLPSTLFSDSLFSPCTFHLTSHYLVVNSSRYPYDSIEGIATSGSIRQYIRIDICKHEWWDEDTESRASRRGITTLKKYSVEPQVLYLKGLKSMRQRNFVALVRYLNGIGVKGGIIGELGRNERRKRGGNMPLEVDLLLGDEEGGVETVPMPESIDSNATSLTEILQDAHQIHEKNQEILQSLHRQKHLIQHSEQDMEYMKYLLSISDKLLRSINSVRGTIWNIFSGTIADPDEKSSSKSATLEEKIHFLLEKQVPIIFVKHSERPFNEQIYTLVMMIFFTDAIRVVDQEQNILRMIPYDSIWKYEENDIEAVIHYDKCHDKEMVFYSRFNEKIGARLKALCEESMRYYVLPSAVAEKRHHERIQRVIRRTLEESGSGTTTKSSGESSSTTSTDSNTSELLKALREKQKQESLAELSNVLSNVKSMQVLAGEYLDESTHDLDHLKCTVEEQKEHIGKSNDTMVKKTEQIKKNWIIF